MDDHEPSCATWWGYNWCTCILHAEYTVARGFALHLDRTRQVDCPGGEDSHAEWWLPATGCPWCKAVV